MKNIAIKIMGEVTAKANTISLIWAIGTVPSLLLDSADVLNTSEFFWISNVDDVANIELLSVFLFFWFFLILFICFSNMGIVPLIFLLEVGMLTPIVSMTLLNMLPVSTLLFFLNAIAMEAVVGVILVLVYIKDWKYRDFMKTNILESGIDLKFKNLKAFRIISIGRELFNSWYTSIFFKYIGKIIIILFKYAYNLWKVAKIFGLCTLILFSLVAYLNLTEQFSICDSIKENMSWPAPWNLNLNNTFYVVNFESMRNCDNGLKGGWGVDWEHSHSSYWPTSLIRSLLFEISRDLTLRDQLLIKYNNPLIISNHIGGVTQIILENSDWRSDTIGRTYRQNSGNLINSTESIETLIRNYRLVVTKYAKLDTHYAGSKFNSNNETQNWDNFKNSYLDYQNFHFANTQKISETQLRQLSSLGILKRSESAEMGYGYYGIGRYFEYLKNIGRGFDLWLETMGLFEKIQVPQGLNVDDGEYSNSRLGLKLYYYGLKYSRKYIDWRELSNNYFRTKWVVSPANPKLWDYGININLGNLGLYQSLPVSAVGRLMPPKNTWKQIDLNNTLKRGSNVNNRAVYSTKYFKMCSYVDSINLNITPSEDNMEKLWNLWLRGAKHWIISRKEMVRKVNLFQKYSVLEWQGISPRVWSGIGSYLIFNKNSDVSYSWSEKNSLGILKLHTLQKPWNEYSNPEDDLLDRTYVNQFWNNAISYEQDYINYGNSQNKELIKKSNFGSGPESLQILKYWEGYFGIGSNSNTAIATIENIQKESYDFAYTKNWNRIERIELDLKNQENSIFVKNISKVRRGTDTKNNFPKSSFRFDNIFGDTGVKICPISVFSDQSREYGLIATDFYQKMRRGRRRRAFTRLKNSLKSKRNLDEVIFKGVSYVYSSQKLNDYKRVYSYSSGVSGDNLEKFDNKRLSGSQKFNKMFTHRRSHIKLEGEYNQKVSNTLWDISNVTDNAYQTYRYSDSFLNSENFKIRTFMLPENVSKRLDSYSIGMKRQVSDRMLKTFKKQIYLRNQRNSENLITYMKNTTHDKQYRNTNLGISSMLLKFPSILNYKSAGYSILNYNNNLQNYIKSGKVVQRGDFEVHDSSIRGSFEKPHTLYGYLWDEYLSQIYGVNLNFIDFKNPTISPEFWEGFKNSSLSGTKYNENIQNKIFGNFGGKILLSDEVGAELVRNNLSKFGYVKSMLKLSKRKLNSIDDFGVYKKKKKLNKVLHQYNFNFSWLQKFVESHSKHFEHLAGYDYQKIAEKLKVPYKKQNYWLRVDSEYRKNQYFKPFGWLNTKNPDNDTYYSRFGNLAEYPISWDVPKSFIKHTYGIKSDLPSNELRYEGYGYLRNSIKSAVIEGDSIKNGNKYIKNTRNRLGWSIVKSTNRRGSWIDENSSIFENLVNFETFNSQAGSVGYLKENLMLIKYENNTKWINDMRKLRLSTIRGYAKYGDYHMFRNKIVLLTTSNSKNFSKSQRKLESRYIRKQKYLKEFIHDTPSNLNIPIFIKTFKENQFDEVFLKNYENSAKSSSKINKNYELSSIKYSSYSDRYRIFGGDLKNDYKIFEIKNQSYSHHINWENYSNSLSYLTDYRLNTYSGISGQLSNDSYLFEYLGPHSKKIEKNKNKLIRLQNLGHINVEIYNKLGGWFYLNPQLVPSASLMVSLNAVSFIKSIIRGWEMAYELSGYLSTINSEKKIAIFGIVAIEKETELIKRFQIIKKNTDYGITLKFLISKFFKILLLI